MSPILTSTDYCRSPLVQDGLEIACKIIVKLPETVRNHLLMDRYVEIVKVNYIEPKHEVTLGSFLKKRLLQPNQETKREIHRTLTIQGKNRSQIRT